MVVSGYDLREPLYRFVKVIGGEEIVYTPLGGGPYNPIYLLTDNGIYRIIANGEVVRTITIEDMVISSQITNIVACGQMAITNPVWSGALNRAFTNERCLNYPVRVSDSLPYLLVRLELKSGASFDWNKLSLSNARSNGTYESGIVRLMNFSPIDEGSPVVLFYDDYIILVSNYEQQRRRRR